MEELGSDYDENFVSMLDDMDMEFDVGKISVWIIKEMEFRKIIKSLKRYCKVLKNLNYC